MQVFYKVVVLLQKKLHIKFHANKFATPFEDSGCNIMALIFEQGIEAAFSGQGNFFYHNMKKEGVVLH